MYKVTKITAFKADGSKLTFTSNVPILDLEAFRAEIKSELHAEIVRFDYETIDEESKNE